MELYQINDDTCIKRIGFKAQMSNLELYGLQACIDKMNDEDAMEDSVETLGLAYTSSSEYAMLSVCGEGFHEGYSISHFAVLNDGRGVMVCRDDNCECYVYFIIEG